VRAGRLAEERRRVQLVGGSTFTISLPKWWAQRVGLKPGQEVSLRVLPDGSLLLTIGGERRGLGESLIKVTPRTSCSRLVREVIVRYVMGFESIRIVSSETIDLDLKNCIVEFASSRMIGVEVIEEYSNMLLLQCFTPPDMVSVSKVVQRMSRTASYMLKDAVEGVVRGSEELLEDVIRRDDVVDKFYLYLLRQLNGVLAGRVDPRHVGIGSVLEAPFLMIAGKYVERVGDYSELLSRTWLSYRVRLEHEVVKGILDLVPETLKLFERSVSSLVGSASSDELHEVIDLGVSLRARYREEGSKILPGLKDLRVFAVVKTLVDSLSRVAEYVSDIAEAALNIHALRAGTLQS
jgi:phosphate uptake regulator